MLLLLQVAQQLLYTVQWLAEQPMLGQAKRSDALLAPSHLHIMVGTTPQILCSFTYKQRSFLKRK